MEITISKVVAVVVAIGYAIAIVANVGLTKHATSILALLVPLGLIWFPEELGSYTGYVGRGSTINAETPPFIVSGMGWLILVLIGVSFVAYSLDAVSELRLVAFHAYKCSDLTALAASKTVMKLRLGY